MIRVEEFRLGNYLLQKIQAKILRARFGPEHFAMVQNGLQKDLFALVLTPEIFLQLGFIENKDYPLLPEAREFKLAIPVVTDNVTEIQGYLKNNKECFARLAVNNFVASNPVYAVHQLQNLYNSLKGKVM